LIAMASRISGARHDRAGDREERSEARKGTTGGERAPESTAVSECGIVSTFRDSTKAPGSKKGKARDKAAEAVGASPQYVQDAKTLEREA
jgi:hypothetical protein